MIKAKQNKYYLLIILITASIIFGSCLNPFSPKIDNSTNNQNILSDQKTVEGVFLNFKYAYTFKDTSIYGQLLAEDFVFTYYDYDLGVEVSWDRPTDMKTTNGLFQNTQDLTLIWNNIVFQEGDSLFVDVKRSFNLTITFNPNDVINFFGFADLTLARNNASEIWRIKRWKDLTNP
jgi:hypothetical protein